jgi:hypothetical protein
MINSRPNEIRERNVKAYNNPTILNKHIIYCARTNNYKDLIIILIQWWVAITYWSYLRIDCWVWAQ